MGQYSRNHALSLMRAKYHKIVARIADDIHSGRLQPGARLPTHRQLAWEHGLSLGTATRVFAELDAMGLTTGEVGRGTFVRRQSDVRAGEFVVRGASAEKIDLRLNHFLLPEQDDLFQSALQEVLTRGTDVLGYRDTFGDPQERARIADWLSATEQVPRVDPARLVVCAGGQHGLFLSLAATCRPGDVIVIEALSYPVIRQACALLHLNVVEVASDANGIRPDALDALCRDTPVKLLFTMPNLQNPTSVTMPEARRRDLAEVIRRHDLWVIEDDAYGFLLPDPPVSLAALMPERVFYLRPYSKSWAPGLRIAHLVFPAGLEKRIEQAQSGTIWTAVPFMASVIGALIDRGAYAEITAAKRKEIAKRQRIFATELGAYRVQTAPQSMHALVHLPPGHRSSTLVSTLFEAGVIVAPLRQFAAPHGEGQPIPEGVRLCLGAPPDRRRLQQGLALLAAHLGPRS
ncbi:PLP-dependent aminotransferase family protein [Celeribacter sp.]|uniref:aminotransferase-like domain-containing protein n=1 Tax=Celeribacter sp. TaxID=1890673 RepID=UPI003A8DBF3B